MERERERRAGANLRDIFHTFFLCEIAVLVPLVERARILLLL